MTSYFSAMRLNCFLRSLVLTSYVLCAAARATEPTRDIRIVVDISGSMQKTDPHLLRQPAVRLLADLLPKGTQAGVWTFGKYVNMLVPLKPVTDEWRSMAKTRAADINSIAAFTNIGEAIEIASTGWQKPDANSDRHLILLTDGWIDISNSASENHQARQAIVHTLLPTLKNNGVKFHTLALADDVDKELLQLLATTTQGSYHEAHNADDLLKVFVSAFDQSVKPQQVPIEADGFTIDAGVNEFTALIFKKNIHSKLVELVSPKGQHLSAKQKDSNVKWLADAHFDLMTISAPTAGKWQLIADLDPGNRVTIISDLNLQVQGFPAVAAVGDDLSLDISLTEKGKIIERQDFLRLLNVAVNHQQGGHHSKKILNRYQDPTNIIPSDGIYHFELAEALDAGEHEFSVEVDTQTFKRVYKQTLQVTTAAKKNTADTEKKPLHPTPKPSATPTIESSKISEIETKTETTEHGAEGHVIEQTVENDDNFNKPASEFENDNFTEAEDTRHDDSGVLTAEDPEPDGMDTPHADQPKATATPTTQQIVVQTPISQQAWFKWAIAGSILFANLLLFTIGALWYRHVAKRRQAEDQLEDASLQENAVAISPAATVEQPPHSTQTQHAETEKTTATESVIDAEEETASIDEGEILEDPLKDLHADEFDHDLDMPEDENPR